jgi:hypothetical protein
MRQEAKEWNKEAVCSGKEGKSAWGKEESKQGTIGSRTSRAKGVIMWKNLIH